MVNVNVSKQFDMFFFLNMFYFKLNVVFLCVFSVLFFFVESMPVMSLCSLSSSDYREAMLSSFAQQTDKNRMTAQSWHTKRR